MGRPVKRDVNGTEVFGTYINDAGIKVTAYLNGSAQDAYIISQKGARRYKVTDAATGDYITVAKLVSGSPSADGEMLMVGYLAVDSFNPSQQPVPAPIAISHLNKRTATDFNDNRYTWVLVNDSSYDYIQLTPV